LRPNAGAAAGPSGEEEDDAVEGRGGAAVAGVRQRAAGARLALRGAACARGGGAVCAARLTDAGVAVDVDAHTRSIREF